MSGFHASKAQRMKVRFALCSFCGAGPGCDPMHVIPRSLGGCDDPLCVVSACRSCHTSYDTGRLDALAALESLHRRELAHAVEHVGLIATLRRVTNDREAATP